MSTLLPVDHLVYLSAAGTTPPLCLDYLADCTWWYEPCNRSFLQHSTPPS